MTVTTSAEAYKNLLALMKKHSNFGAQDSEGYHALDRLENAIEQGKPFPFVRKDDAFTRACGGWNPWELQVAAGTHGDYSPDRPAILT